jgi:Arc/MetJ family transcription regulator
MMHLDINIRMHQDATMRTTLTIDDDVARELTRLAGDMRGGLRSTVNQLLRRGLSVGARPDAKQKRFVVHAQACGFLPGIDALRLNALNDELETDAFVASHRGDRKCR